MRTLILAFTFLLLCSFSVITPTYATTNSAGILTEAQGVVFTRDFANDNKTVWAKPAAAKVGDSITEGMQIGTGKESWAQIEWDNITTRAWHNTVYTVMPNQKLVYLIGGDMMFNHDRQKGDGDYTICTKHLQVLARGTTLLMQEGKDGSRVSVIEGIAEITNQLDKSVLTLTPGMSYEARPKAGRARHQHNDGKGGKKGNASPLDASSDILDVPVTVNAIQNVALDQAVQVFGDSIGFELLDLPGTVNAVAGLIEELLLFDNTNVTSYISSLPAEILDDKLFSSFQKQLLKQQFINKQLMKALGGKNSVLKNLQINQLPLVGNYAIGGDVLELASLSALNLQHFSPTSVVPSGTDPLGLGKNLGLKRYRIVYNKKTTRLNATFLNPSTGGKNAAVTSLLAGKTSPLNSVTGGKNSSSVVPTAALLGSRGGLLSSKGGALSPVTGLTGGLTGTTGLGNTLNSVTRSVGGLGGILGR